MRYKPEHKGKARALILDKASRRLQKVGFDGVGVNALMEDAGMTTGAFYSHFSSKDELLLEVLRKGLSEIIGRLDLRVESQEPVWVNSVLAKYFTTGHCIDVEVGCILPALTVDASRGGNAPKELYLEWVLKIVDRLTLGVKNPENEDARKKAWTVLSLMVGAVTVARALPAGDAQNEILASVIEISKRMV